jgi:ATP synthase protein I
MGGDERLKRAIETQARRIAQAERDRPTLLAQTVFLGTLALLFVLPVVGGAYLGHWIDTGQPGYSYRWTMIGLGAGLIVGGINVYVYLRNH